MPRVLGALLCLSFASTLSAAEVRPSKVLSSSDAKLAPNVDTLPSDTPDKPADHCLAPYFAAPGTDKALEALPLKETSTSVSIAGVVARVQLRQVFENTGDKPLEATYVFPASTHAAVHGMRMKIGKRTVEAGIEKRAEARKQFEKARDEGKRAALLEQQRPNVFTTTVTNLMPKDRIEVELEYSELLVPADSVYELVVPAVVGPRYGGGAEAANDKWVANPYLQAGEKEPFAFDVQVKLETALPLRDVSSPSHEIDVAYAGRTSASVALKTRDGAGTRDFVLRYRLAGEQIDAGLLVSTDKDQHFFTLMLEPPERPKLEEVVPREYVFVLDVSGSMYGFPIDTAKQLLRELVTHLRPTDHFNVVLFAGYAGVMSERSLPASTQNVQQALAFIQGSGAGGGTELLAGLSRAYAIPPAGEKVSRTVVVITDGYVVVEGKAFKFVREHLDAGNLFAFGIGTSVNRGLIEALARAGEGEPFVVASASDAEAKAAELRKMIEQPVLTNIRVRYQGFDAYEVAPMKIPDLMARRPLVLFGKFKGAAEGEIEVTGDAAGKPFRKVLKVAEAARPAEALQWLWARRWVETLEDQFHLTQADEVKAAITDLGLSYRLLTPFTSFVAVDSEVANASGARVDVKQPLPMPQGVSNNAVGGVAGLLGTASGSAVGSGGLGVQGFGGGGGGYGMGAGSVGTVRTYGMGKSEEGKAGKSAPLGGRSSTAVGDETPRVSGSLDVTLVRQALRRHQAEVRYCYEAELVKSPALNGSVTVELTIDATGKIARVRLVRSTLANPAVETCLVSRMQRWVFPAPAGDGGATVTTSWVFKPGT